MSNAILTRDQLRQAAPSIFADHASAKVSSLYSFIPTTKILDKLENAGWFPVKAQEQTVRTPERMGFQKHMIRFRQDGGKMAVGDVFPEIVLTNAHDATAAFVFHAGLFRLACTNGLVVAESTFEAVRIMHFSKLSEVQKVTSRALSEIPTIMSKVQLWKNRVLQEEEQRAFALKSMLLKYETKEKAPINPSMLLRARRPGDDGADLWNVFNRVQENIIRGGQRDLSKSLIDKNGHARLAGRTREVRSIDEQVSLNKGIWHLADTMAEAKDEREFLELVEAK